jgi:hypothetical protein
MNEESGDSTDNEGNWLQYPTEMKEAGFNIQ